MGHPRHRVGQKRKAEAWGTRRLVDSAAEDVARHQVATGIRFFDQIRSVVQVHAVPLLNSPPKRVIFESYRGLIRRMTRCQPVFKVPSVRGRSSAIRLGQDIAVVIVGVSRRTRSGEFIGIVVGVTWHAQRAKPVAHRIKSVRLRHGAGNPGELIDVVVGEIRHRAVQQVALAGAVARGAPASATRV